MSLRRRSVLLRVALLVLVPLTFLIALSAYTVTTSISSALTLTRSKVVMDDLANPVARLQQALARERAQVVIYAAQPATAAQTALQQQESATDHAVASFTAAAGSSSVRQSASADGKKAIAELSTGLADLPRIRGGIVRGILSGQQAFTDYNDLIATSYGVLEQAIIQEGSSTQVLPGIAVIELGVSNEYLQQESALLNADFAVRAFPASAHQAFVRLVGAHRLLYEQSYSYLDSADRASLDHDVSARAANSLAALENRLVAASSMRGAPPVRAGTWNSLVATVSAQTERAVGQAEASFAAGARAQANGKLRELYLAGGLGLIAVIISLVLSLWIAVNLARRLRDLRDSALNLAHVRLPDVVRRLRAGEDVDVPQQVPPLAAGADEIGQVKSAFNAAQRTAVEAAVDEARVRRGINDVFRNLARRSQALLERQLALLDALERRASEPEDLESLFRIDHLSTRMRRHAESLVVLAGDSPKRAFREPVPFVDVLRAAAAEVEDYTRIRVTCLAPAALASHAVADVIHMLAEFVENATTFSPPNTEVRITGDLVAKGFAVDIEDRGLGMSDDEIAAANASLQNPPLFDLSGSDRFGLFVAAQLARRHGIHVTLRHSAYGGATAIVLIPRDLVVLVNALGQNALPGPAPIAPANGRVVTAVRPAVPAQPVAWDQRSREDQRSRGGQPPGEEQSAAALGPDAARPPDTGHRPEPAGDPEAKRPPEPEHRPEAGQRPGPARREDAASGEATDREAAGREAADREAAGRETAGRETAGRDAAGREAADREAAGKDAAARNGAGREAAGRDVAERRPDGGDPGTPARPGQRDGGVIRLSPPPEPRPHPHPRAVPPRASRTPAEESAAYAAAPLADPDLLAPPYPPGAPPRDGSPLDSPRPGGPADPLDPAYPLVPLPSRPRTGNGPSSRPPGPGNGLSGNGLLPRPSGPGNGLPSRRAEPGNGLPSRRAEPGNGLPGTGAGSMTGPGVPAAQSRPYGPDLAADLPSTLPFAPPPDPPGPPPAVSADGSGSGLAVFSGPERLPGPERRPGEERLPQRIRQASLAPQLRRPMAAASAPPPAARSPEAARSMMSAFQRGWQRGLSDSQQEPGTGPNPRPEGESR